jgi:superfamily II DNA or RNA helicase
MDEIITFPESTSTHRTYWQAQGFVELEQSQFAAETERGNSAGQRSAYYRLAVYHGRTTYILRSALSQSKEPLAQAAMRNLNILHRALTKMHIQASHVVPVALTLDRSGRDEFARDLVVRALSESPEPLPLTDIVQHVNDLDVMGVRKGTVERHLKDLISSGHVVRTSERPSLYTRSERSYTETNIDALSLGALVGADLYLKFEEAGYRGLNDIEARQLKFRGTFTELTGFSDASGALFTNLVSTLLEDRTETVSPWPLTDIIGSPYPRPYQYEAYSVFRGYGYEGQLVEAPTGSGKTMIGMMCIQDWLSKLRPGQSILVLVPTTNYQQQWTGELCYKPIGLRISPEVVFSGTPNQLERFKKRTGSHPAILLMTYTALAQAGSGVGKGGFDIDSIEMFLQGANVQYVILDEVHKVVEDMKRVSTSVARLMVEWLKDGSIRGLIGFSGTAVAYRARFAELGLKLVYSIPIDELIAAGFVAPFAEFGMPFSYSDRERHIRDLLDAYKANMTDFLKLIGGKKLRAWFAAIPMEERVDIGHEMLSMYRGRADWQEALNKRLKGWESGGDLKLTELKLASMVQINHDWSDVDLVQAAGADQEQYESLIAAMKAIREELSGLIYIPKTLERLSKPGYGNQFDKSALYKIRSDIPSIKGRVDATKDELCTTIVGLYEGVVDWYRRVGEGRVESVKAVIEAERAMRPISGFIIFDNARKIHWKNGVATPGYEGLGGLYAHMLGDERFTPYAVLSSEQYLPYSDENPLPPRIAEFVERELMNGEIAQAMFDLATQGINFSPQAQADLQTRWDELIAKYISRLGDVHAARPSDFNRRVLRRMRDQIRRLDLGNEGKHLSSRLDMHNVHFADLVHTFFDYAIIARYFRQAKVAELEQVSGARQKFFVVPMSSGSRKQLMYDLTSRIVDAESLPINMVVVSSWARTGWNVISPNVLIDATATRDVTAWQQLRGRAIRARRTWTNDCYRLIMVLIGSQMQGLVEGEDMPEDVIEILEGIESHETEIVLDERLQALLDEVTPKDLRAKVTAGGLPALTDEQRTRIAISLMEHYNKVTHIFEMIKAYGSTSQVLYDRTERVWKRRPNIAAKHTLGVSVNPFTGEKTRDASHAPLIYVKDPRSDLPADLQALLLKDIRGKDDVIIAGWFEEHTTEES